MEEKDRLVEWDKRFVWHPFTQMREYLRNEPLIIERAEGPFLVDLEGRRYIDGVSSIWVSVHGHGKKAIVDAIKRQADLVCHTTLLGLANVPSIVLAERLVAISPKNLTKVFYSDNGSTAVEVALKMSFQYLRHKGEDRDLFLSFDNGYHGDTLGAVSVGGIATFHSLFRPLLFKTVRAPSPYCYRCPLKLERTNCGLSCLAEFEALLRKYRDRLCAVILEPGFQGAGGIIVQPEGFARVVWEATRREGVMFIADEVATGFGRTGYMFFCDKEGIEPDFLCLAKGITGGYLPLAATLTTEEVYNAFLAEFHEFKTFFHGHTFTGNPLACACAIESLRVFEEERVLESVKEKVAVFSTELLRFYELSHVGDVRQLGLAAGIELVKERETKQPYDPREQVGQRVIMEARKRGAILRPLGDVIVLMPPLSIPEDTLRELLHITFESIRAATGD
jgi:adenosylmethionine-8-amino-7-oxononanoate aminotransferase